jgi:ribonucleoside-diphosphate reductase alpha chain
MHASDAVLSGGVRRSATLCLFSPDDDEMLKAKTGNWFYENPQRARSNNSVLLLRGSTTKEQFAQIMKYVQECGEPGFFWADSNETLYNPCGEIGLYAYDTDGKSGWAVCNLSEINGKKIKCEEDFAIAARGAAIIGTLQAGYTDFDYLGSVSENIIRREALLGVSITGMMDNPDIIFNPEIQRKMAKLIVKTNEEVAKLIGINPAARSCCVKPSGTTSCILGSASGVHPHHAKRYFRRVQGNALEPVLQYFKQYNRHAVEKSVWAANQTDEIITFTIEVPDGAKTKNQLSACELLEYVKLTQQNWIAYGKVRERCVKEWLSHNVSNTITVLPDEWDEVAEYIYKNRKWFAGVSLLPESGDLDYPQAPMCRVRTSKEILAEYGDGALMASGLIVDGLHAFGDLWKGCDAVLGLGEDLSHEPNAPLFNTWFAKTDWVRRVNQFALRYCNNDVKRTTYLLKEVNNYKLYLDLQREYRNVPYEDLTEEENNVSLLETVACAGGQCEMSFRPSIVLSA